MESDPITAIKDGQMVEVNADEGIVKVIQG
jgi:hypothetical protein